MNKKIIAGNWKMNMLPNDTIDFITSIEPMVKDTDNEVVLCVPYIDIFYAVNAAQGTNIKIGAENMHYEEKGAFTGEVSGQMLKSVGVEYVIIGHSERRAYYNETDESVNKKLKSALELGLKPIVCVGETLDQREAGIEKDIVTSQTEKAFEGISSEDALKTVVAYEPVWAIGTGKTATPDDANTTIKYVREKLAEMYGDEVARNIPIQYGGSVKSSNAKELFGMSDIDGALIGGASLKVDEFAAIVNYNK